VGTGDAGVGEGDKAGEECTTCFILLSVWEGEGEEAAGAGVKGAERKCLCC
jgi:hypothetical protein